MPTIVEKITETEARAAAIKHDAVLKGREDLAAAKKQAADAVAAAREQARAEFDRAEALAEANGRTAAEEICAANAKKADALCDVARKNLAEAAAYIVERVETA